MATALIVAIPSMAQAADDPRTRPFAVKSNDGTRIEGQADLPAGTARVAVVMSAGTGLFDRDVLFGKTGADDERLFKALARRFAAHGLAAVRYDRRGVRYGKAGAERLDAAVAGTSTNETQRDDLAAVYAWSRSKDGLGARCVILFGHSEGTLHIARLADAGARPPLAVIGIGPVAASPARTIRWQFSERDAFSFALMDADGDGRVTKAEVEAGWQRTPSSAFDLLAPLLPPDGVAWTKAQIDEVRARQGALYQGQKAAALALSDDGPYPNSATPMARNSWWKGWFADETPTASLFAKWARTPIIFHWGAIDSQTPPSLNEPVARQWLGDRARLTVHPALGHSLGRHALYGPMDEAVADRIADEAAAEARRCR